MIIDGIFLYHLNDFLSFDFNHKFFYQLILDEDLAMNCY